jgi:hypothetical protein
MPLAISKEKTWEKLRYKPHAAQTPIHRSQARFRVNAAGRRTGKSTAGGHELVPEAILTRTMQARLEDLGRRREFWIVGPEYSDSEKEFRVFWDDCKRLGIPFDKPGSYYNPLAGDLQVSLCKGRFLVIGKSAKYPATLVGEGLSGVIMAEAAKVKSQVWTKFVRPTLADYKGWALFNSTPEGRNWFYHLWQQGRNPDFTGWESWRHPSWMNDILFPMGRQDEEILAMEREMTPSYSSKKWRRTSRSLWVRSSRTSTKKPTSRSCPSIRTGRPTPAATTAGRTRSYGSYFKLGQTVRSMFCGSFIKPRRIP